MTIPMQEGFKVGAQVLPTVQATETEMADAGTQMLLAGSSRWIFSETLVK